METRTFFFTALLISLGCGEALKSPDGSVDSTDTGGHENGPDDTGGDDTGTDDSGRVDTGGEDSGIDTGSAAAALGTIQGRVLDIYGQPVFLAQVEAGGITTATDNMGQFSLSDVEAGPNVDVIVRSDDYSTGHVRIALDEDEDSMVVITVAPAFVSVLPDAAAGGTIVSIDGVEIDFPAGSLVDAAGNPISGPIEVKTSLLDEAHEAAAAPGGMKADAGDGTIDQLESFGMVEVELTQGGEPVELALPVELSIPLFSGTPFADGEEVGLYHFDEDVGVWTLDGTGTIDGGKFVASVEHFSWWNCDQPLDTTNCICGEAVDDSGDLLTSGFVQVSGIDYMGGSSATIESDGSFCVNVKRDSENSLYISGSNGSGYYESTITATSGTEATDCSLGGCEDVGSIVGNPLEFGCVTGTLTGYWEEGLQVQYWIGPFAGATEAIPMGGSFCITVPANLGVGTEGGSWLYLYVAQSGPGIDAHLEEFCSGSLAVEIDESLGTCEEGGCQDVGALDVICSDRVGEGGEEGEAKVATADSSSDPTVP